MSLISLSSAAAAVMVVVVIALSDICHRLSFITFFLLFRAFSVLFFRRCFGFDSRLVVVYYLPALVSSKEIGGGRSEGLRDDSGKSIFAVV